MYAGITAAAIYKRSPQPFVLLWMGSERYDDTRKTKNQADCSV